MDPDTQTVEEMGPPLHGDDKYFGDGVLAPNGRIYFAPYNAGKVLSCSPKKAPPPCTHDGDRRPRATGDDLGSYGITDKFVACSSFLFDTFRFFVASIPFLVVDVIRLIRLKIM